MNPRGPESTFPEIALVHEKNRCAKETGRSCSPQMIVRQSRLERIRVQGCVDSCGRYKDVLASPLRQFLRLRVVRNRVLNRRSPAGTCERRRVGGTSVSGCVGPLRGRPMGSGCEGLSKTLRTGALRASRHYSDLFLGGIVVAK